MPIHVDNLIHTTYELPRLLKLQVIYKLDKAKPTRMHFSGPRRFWTCGTPINLKLFRCENNYGLIIMF